jgi:hypothetical protein
MALLQFFAHGKCVYLDGARFWFGSKVYFEGIFIFGKYITYSGRCYLLTQ